MPRNNPIVPTPSSMKIVVEVNQDGYEPFTGKEKFCNLRAGFPNPHLAGMAFLRPIDACSLIRNLAHRGRPKS